MTKPINLVQKGYLMRAEFPRLVFGQLLLSSAMAFNPHRGK
jgi:hypothetical protein